MPKSFEQETLEIESARISADLAYQREREILLNKPLFSKKQIEEIKGKLGYYFIFGFGIGLVFAWIVCKILKEV